jgi:hypothetical protein
LIAEIPLSGDRTFQVRFGPENPSSCTDRWANNLGLAQAGTVEVTGEFVRLANARNLQPETRRSFAMNAIANVGIS